MDDLYYDRMMFIIACICVLATSIMTNNYRLLLTISVFTLILGLFTKLLEYAIERRISGIAERTHIYRERAAERIEHRNTRTSSTYLPSQSISESTSSDSLLYSGSLANILASPVQETAADNNGSETPIPICKKPKEIKRNTIRRIIINTKICIMILMLLSISCKSAAATVITEIETIALYIESRTKKVDAITAYDIACAVVQHSWDNRISPALVVGIMEAESLFDRFAVSKVGARGLMQVLCLKCGITEIDKERLFEISYNIKYGICILKDKARATKGDYMKALYYYVGGRKSSEKADRIAKAYVKKVCSNMINFLNFKQIRRYDERQITL